MKQLIQLDTFKLIDEYEATGKFTLIHPYKNKKNAFMLHMLALFSTIPLVRNGSGMAFPTLVSAHKTLAAIPDNHTTTEGVFSRAKIIDLIWICKNIPRGKLMSDSQVKDPTYGAMTPLFMYAHKRDNGVKYSEWDHRSPRVNAFLGQFLATANDFRLAYPGLVLEPTVSLRKSIAKDHKYDAWNPYCTYDLTLDPVDDEDVGEKVRIPKEIVMMIFQFWIANAENRKTDSMLLDIYSYGRVPIALDAVIPMEERSREDDL